MMDSRTGKTELWCLVNKRVDPSPPSLGKQLILSDGVSSATTAASTVSVRGSSGRTSRSIPEAGAATVGTSNPSPSF